MAGDVDYQQWTHGQLVARVKELEARFLPQAPAVDQSSTPPKPSKAFDASKYCSRLIALKFAYLGQKYNGLEHHNNNTTPLPTIEEELWKALVKTRLISPTSVGGEEGKHARADVGMFEKWDRAGVDVNWDGCEYSKCGRTDRGVSAFGQVIGVRVRSKRPLPKSKDASSPSPLPEPSAQEAAKGEQDHPPLPSKSEPEESPKPFHDTKDELPYIQLLNRVLPPDIRIYAWCPNPPPDFSARFSCKERRYKYFFTNPCFAPPPGSAGLYTSADQSTMREGWLDIEKMREGCRSLVGLHDFRNFCKVDASKQITNFERRIFHADIEEVSSLSVPGFLPHAAISNPSTLGKEKPKMYSFTLHGSAFLWHQVRSLVAILFLVGQGLESPSLIPALLDVKANPTRPKYDMASDAPLVLWDCIFPHPSEVQDSEDREHGYQDRLDWVYVGDEGGTEAKRSGKASHVGLSSTGRGKWGKGGVIDDVWEVWRKNKMDETLSALLIDSIAAQGQSTLDSDDLVSADAGRVGIMNSGPRVFDGGDVGKTKGRYTPVLQRERNDPVEEVNARYAKRKGLDAKKMQVKDDEANE
jgi:tRNA pseudouridine38/39 synthase